MSQAKESDFGTLVNLLIMAGSLIFLIYMTIGHGGALNVPFFL
jgi:hypothetical protein